MTSDMTTDEATATAADRKALRVWLDAQAEEAARVQQAVRAMTGLLVEVGLEMADGLRVGGQAFFFGTAGRRPTPSTGRPSYRAVFTTTGRRSPPTPSPRTRRG